MQKFISRNSKPKLPPVRVVNTVNKLRSGFTKLNKQMVPPSVALLEMISGSWVSQAVCAMADAGVADHIPETGAACKILAQKTGLQAGPLYRVMRALSVVGVFIEKDDQVFRLTSIGKCLRSDHPQSMRYMAIFQGKMNWAHWGELSYCLRTGKNAVEHVRGMKPFEFLSQNPAEAEIFDKAMTNISEMEIDAILAAYNFSKFKTIADIGGGRGAFLAAILMTHPSVRGILFDLSHVVEGTKSGFTKSDLGDRVQIQSGNFFENVPAGADAYIMKHIIHDWSDGEAIQILKNIRAQIPPHGKLLLVEAVIPGPNVPHFAKFLDLEMLVVNTGQERTRDEYAEILVQADFKLERILPTISMAQVIEARPN